MSLPATPLTSYVKRIERLLQTRYGLWFVGIISFVESALVVPIITDPFLIVYILANQSRAAVAVIVTTVTSLMGGLVAYFLAAFFYNFTFAYLSPESLVEFHIITQRFREETFVLTLLGAITPVPYTLVALAAGFVKGNIISFILATIAGRLLRYSVVGYLTYRFGVRAIEQLQKNLLLLSLVTVVGVIVYILFY